MKLLRRRAQRGQAMIEYSAITYLLVLAGGVSIVLVLPRLMNALSAYTDGIYFMLNLALP